MTFRNALIAFSSIALASCASVPSTTPAAPAPTQAASSTAQLRVVDDIDARLRQLPPTPIDYDRSLLDANEAKVLARLIEASKLIDEIYLRQMDERNPAWRANLAAASKTWPRYASALHFFDVMKGPWDSLKEDEPFLVDAGPRSAGGGFYPLDMKKEEFESWIAAHPADRDAFQGLNSVIRRKDGRLVAVPYSVQYRDLLQPAAAKLSEAAALTSNATLRDYLTKLATAFGNDDYYPSDLAWMDLDSPIEVVIGPYEVYQDRLFNYKASFESFVNVVDRPESEKLALYSHHLADMERHLPLDDRYKNATRGSDSPIRVVQEVFTAGDARRGVQTAAFNLPNDERVREAKGSKKVMLKNVMEAKYRQSGAPIAARVLDASQLPLLSFPAFFNHVLFHELSHGIGPGMITGPDGKRVENRILLKDLHSAIEECKADVLGVWNLVYAIDEGWNRQFTKEQLYATNAGLMFRSMRFGIDDAHGRGTAVQWNWYREHGAIVPTADGHFRVDASRSLEAVRSLANELLMIEATGDYARAQRLLEQYGRSNAEIAGVIARLQDIPVDIDPVYVAAGEK